MRKSEITLMSQRAADVKKAQESYFNNFINLVLKRAPNRSFYFPLGMIYFNADNKEWLVSNVSWDDKLDVMNATIYHRVNGTCMETETRTYATLPLQAILMIDLAIMDKDIMTKQSLYKSEVESVFAETEYYLAESKMRHALVKKIEEFILDSGILKEDKKLVLHNGDVIDMKNKLTMYCADGKSLTLNSFEVSSLKQIDIKVRRTIYDLKH